MKLKTFRGRTMAEALEAVKRQFGRHAMILSTRTLTEGRVFGLGGSPRVEITAARRLEDLPLPLRRDTLKARIGSAEAEGAVGVVSQDARIVDAQPQAALLAASGSTIASGSTGSEALLSEVGALKSLVHDLIGETRRSRLGGGGGILSESYRKLVENDVADRIARQLVDGIRNKLTDDELRDPEAVRVQLAAAVAARLPTAGPIRLSRSQGPRTVALVGPTGVGKTTTIAKLAAHFCLRECSRVGLITIDTYRIAAVEQLRIYADILDIPLAVVVSPREVAEAVDRFSDRDVILIDTAGRSQRDSVKNTELKRIFNRVRPDEVHLVLSSTCSEAVLIDTIQRFADLGIDRLIFTKLDEAIGFGVILACLEKAHAQLSYVTTGQDVPEDIRVGEGGALADLILAGQGRGSEPERAAGIECEAMEARNGRLDERRPESN